MLNDQKKWNSLVKIHNCTKSILLKAEEIDQRHEFFFPPLIQQRDALDHIMRAMFALACPDEFTKTRGAEGTDIEAYATRQLDKAIGHAYRALFDAADWLSIVYREQIRQMLGDYSRQTIHSRFSDMAQCIEPRIDAISTRIAELRMEKDIGNDDQIIAGVVEYQNLLDELEQHWRRVRDMVPELERAEFASSRQSELPA